MTYAEFVTKYEAELKKFLQMEKGTPEAVKQAKILAGLEDDYSGYAERYGLIVAAIGGDAGIL